MRRGGPAAPFPVSAAGGAKGGRGAGGPGRGAPAFFVAEDGGDVVGHATIYSDPVDAPSGGRAPRGEAAAGPGVTLRRGAPGEGGRGLRMGGAPKGA